MSKRLRCLCLFFLGLVSSAALATSSSSGIGAVADSVTGNFAAITNLITGGSYIAGLGFAIGAIMKFKQHKDNPTQVTVGTPVALLFIAASLLFFPSILSTTGYTLFATSGGSVAGPSGMIFGV